MFDPYIKAMPRKMSSENVFLVIKTDVCGSFILVNILFWKIGYTSTLSRSFALICGYKSHIFCDILIFTPIYASKTSHAINATHAFLLL